MEKGHTAPAAIKTDKRNPSKEKQKTLSCHNDSAVVASARRDMVEELENVPTLTPKKPRIQDQPSVEVACAGYIYGQYVQESVRLNNPPLDFITFEARLLGDVELHCAGQNLEQYMPEIRAIEGIIAYKHCYILALDLSYIQKSSNSLHQHFPRPRRSTNSS
jgi:hypothetical protein